MPAPPGGRLIWNEPEWDRVFNSLAGPVAQDLSRKGEIVTQGAKRRSPVSPRGSHGRPSGYLRSNIGWTLGRDTRGLYVDIQSTARTPDGTPYGLLVEIGTKPHVIQSKGPWPLRNARTGQVFGRRVMHPGTRAQPYLRPALDDLRGA